MNLCERHRFAVISAPRRNGKAPVLKEMAANPDLCPYCLLWNNTRKRTKK